MNSVGKENGHKITISIVQRISLELEIKTLENETVVDGILVVKLVKNGCESMAPFQNIVTTQSTVSRGI